MIIRNLSRVSVLGLLAIAGATSAAKGDCWTMDRYMEIRTWVFLFGQGECVSQLAATTAGGLVWHQDSWGLDSLQTGINEEYGTWSSWQDGCVISQSSNRDPVAGFGRAYAESCCVTNPFPPPDGPCCGSSSSAIYTFVQSHNGYIYRSDLCNVPGAWDRYFMMTGAAAGAILWFVPDDPAQFAAFTRVQVNVSGTLTFGNSAVNYGTTHGFDPARGIQRAGVPGAMAWLAPLASRFDGLTATGVPGQYEAVIPLALDPDGVLRADVPSYSFDDHMFDANGDGRFNIADRTAFAGMIASGTTFTPEQLAKWDISRDGTFDSTDLAELQSLIDKGLDSGLPGDANQDGKRSCLDRTAAPASPWNVTIASSSYRIQLDYDLDGDNDGADEIAFNQDVLIDIDFNNDGVFPDDLDVTRFFEVYAGDECPTCDSIDINQNGVFPEVEDVIDFMDKVTGAC